jgi:hypothetical protein
MYISSIMAINGHLYPMFEIINFFEDEKYFIWKYI